MVDLGMFWCIEKPSFVSFMQSNAFFFTDHSKNAEWEQGPFKTLEKSYMYFKKRGQCDRALNAFS